MGYNRERSENRFKKRQKFKLKDKKIKDTFNKKAAAAHKKRIIDSKIEDLEEELEVEIEELFNKNN